MSGPVPGAASRHNGPGRGPEAAGVPARGEVPWWGAVSATAAVALLALGLAAATGLQPPGFAKFSGSVSSLAGRGATDPWVMTLTFALIGACHIVTALALRPAAPAGRLILAGAGVAGFLVASFPQYPGGSPAHALWAGAGFAGMILWPAFSMRRAAVSPRHPPGQAGAAATEAALSLEYHDGTVGRDESTRRMDGGDHARDASGEAPWALRPATCIRVTLFLSLLTTLFTIGQLTHSPALGTAERVTGFTQTLWPLVVVISCRRAQRAG